MWVWGRVKLVLASARRSARGQAHSLRHREPRIPRGQLHASGKGAAGRGDPLARRAAPRGLGAPRRSRTRASEEGRTGRRSREPHPQPSAGLTVGLGAQRGAGRGSRSARGAASGWGAQGRPLALPPRLAALPSPDRGISFAPFFL